MRRIGAVVVALGVVLGVTAVLMAAVPFTTDQAAGDAIVRVDCGVPWMAWADDETSRCAELAQSRVDGAATIGALAILVVAIGFVARRRRPPPRRPATRRPPVRPIPPI